MRVSKKVLVFYDYIELLLKGAYSEIYEDDGTGSISSLKLLKI